MAKSFARQVITGSSVVFTKAVKRNEGHLETKTRYQPFMRMAGTKWKVASRNKKSSGRSGA